MMRASVFRPLSPLLLLAVALVALAVLLVHDAPPAQAQQTTVTLVSNLGQQADGAGYSSSGVVHAQGFTTGSHAQDYTLSSIEINVLSLVNNFDSTKTRAELWSATTGNRPNAKVADLTVPASVSTGTVAFAAPSGTTLTASTNYIFVVYATTVAGGLQIKATRTTSEDSGRQPGWSIANTRWTDVAFTPPTTPSDWNSNSTGILMLRVKGYPILSPTDLSALTAESSTDGNTFAALTGADALAPAFDAATTGYRATVGNDVTHVRLTPTVAHSSSSVTVNGNAVNSGTASERTTLAVGDNDITVRVTAADSSTQDYTVNVRRVPSGAQWHATLTVKDVGSATNFGCSDTLTGSECSTTSVLTADDFTYGGVDYEIQRIIEVSGILVLRLNKTIPADLKSALTFNVDGTAFPLANATLATQQVTWSSTGLSWTAGDLVSLSLTEASATQSSDADLSALTGIPCTDSSTCSGSLTLSPAFNAATTSYTATVGNTITHVKLTPTLSDTANASVTVDGSTVTTGTPSQAIAVSVGSNNAITVRVTAQDSTTKDYTVTITRLGQAQSSDATLSALTGTPCTSSTSCSGSLALSPAFNAATTSYTATVANNITHVKLTPTVNHSAATVTVGGSTVTTGTPSQAIAVSVGSNNAITVRVTAQDSTTKDYTVTITRLGQAQSSDATLSALTGTPCTSSTSCSGSLALSPAFNAATTSYTATVANNITHATLTPTVNHGAATVTVNGMAVNSGQASNAIALSVGANAVTVRVTAEDSTTRAYTVTVTRLAIQVEDWSATLHVKGAGGSNAGCRNNVSRARCSDPSVLTSDEFDYTRYIYGEPYTQTFRVQDLYRTSSTSQNKLVLVANQPLLHTFRGFVLTVLDPRPVPVNDEPLRDNTTPMRFPFDKAVIDGNRATWDYDGMGWFPGLIRPITLGMERPRATLDSIEIYYDGITVDDPDGVDGFVNWAVATPATYGYRVNIPGEFPSIDRDKGVVQTTHAKLKVHGEDPGSTLRMGKVTYSETDQTNAQATPPVVCPYVTVPVRIHGPGGITIVYRSLYRCVALAAVNAGEMSRTIELNAHSPNTLVDIEVTDGGVVRTYLLDIDPPPRTYSVSPTARVVEGQDALLTLTLSKPAPAGGVEFTVTAGLGTAGADDLGAIASPVTVPEGSTTLEVAVPTVDDDQQEEEESFTVTVAPARFGWGVDPLGTATATVTIEDNDDSEGNYADLIAKVKEWRDDPCCVNNQEHTDRWDRVLLTFGETVADTSLEPMTAAEAQTYADRGWTRWVEVTAALRELENRNRAPTVASAIGDAVIVNESGTHRVSLSGVFDDADSDALTITAASSDSSKATVSVASDGSSLTVTAKARGTATITATASDGKGGTVDDAFTVRVKAAPVVASAISDVSGLEVDATQEVSLAGVFRDADNDALTITAASSDDAKATVAVAADQSKLTVTGVAEGTATITVTAQDSDGNRVSDAFEVEVVEAETEAEGDAPTSVLNLRCIAETGWVAFLWDAPEWSGGETYAYDYQLTLPGGRSESGRLIGSTSTLLYRPGSYPAGAETSVSVTAVYELPDGKQFSSAEATLTCTVRE